MKLVLFGAGKIGRSFIGAVFSRALWDVVFVDAVPAIVTLLNKARYYTVVIKREGKPDEERRIGPVRAILAADRDAVAAELVDADLAAVSVGQAAIPSILPLLCAGIKARYHVDPTCPLNVVFAENIRGIAETARAFLQMEAGDIPHNDFVGLVETSIGKMVPLMREADLAGDPLRLFAEEYETLILDGAAFKGSLPPVPALHAVSNIQAWVDRKLFVHNLGHAACAYLGFRANPQVTLLAATLALPGVESYARTAMREAAEALALRYPESYSQSDLDSHIDDLIARFKNKALGDTVHRVGRDLPRKLSREDRVTGAMLLCSCQGLPFDAIAGVYRAALDFRCAGEDGLLFPADEAFHKQYGALPPGKRLEAVAVEVSGLNTQDDVDRAVLVDLLGTRG
jgi:mannitol-1-phosphate 5-dehydrogenase